MNKYTIVKKVFAKSIHQALTKEKHTKPSEIFQDYLYEAPKDIKPGFTDEKK